MDSAAGTAFAKALTGGAPALEAYLGQASINISPANKQAIRDSVSTADPTAFNIAIQSEHAGPVVATFSVIDTYYGGHPTPHTAGAWTRVARK
jgi:hypothetical protein